MKRIISVLIVAIMLMSMSCSAAGALLNNYSCNYVCLGDSVSNGYGLDGYLRPDGTNVRGYKQIVKCAYHYIVPQALNANIEQLGYSGLRAEDMLYLLDAEYESDEYTQRYFIETGRFEVTGGLEKMRKEYEEAVKNADIISINLGSNNFGTYFQEQIAAIEAGNPYQFDRPGYSKNSKLLQNKEYKEAEKTLKSYLETIGAGVEFVKIMVESLRYTYTGFMECYDACIERIYELNPDVNVIALGMYNPIENVKLINGMINIGDIVGLFIDHVNQHIKEKAPYSDTAQYIYVNIRGCHLPSVSVDMLHPDFFTLMYENSSRAIHPDEEGHAFIAEKMLERIRVPYYDVNKEDMSYDAVAYVTEKGLMDAYDTHEFSKNSIATRGMIATALYRMAGSPAVDSNIKFTDVSDGKYYTEAVEWAVENDVIDSINSKIFMPFGGMTRQKLITILWEMAGSPEIDADIDYLDSFLISKSSRTAMAWAVENGIIKGLEGKMISPLGIVTRAQLAMILQRYCEL